MVLAYLFIILKFTDMHSSRLLTSGSTTTATTPPTKNAAANKRQYNQNDNCSPDDSYQTYSTE